MSNPIRKFSQFTADTVDELKKCKWPTKQQLSESTIVVIVCCVALAFTVFGFDSLFQFLLKAVM